MSTKAMAPRFALALFVCVGIAHAKAQTGQQTQTIVLVRHGEKPELGLGQLTCQGLNRALALSAVIAREFGPPAAIKAPDPSDSKLDHGKPYNYVRPLATIEPTAIAFGLPVDTTLGVSKLGALRRALEADAYKNAFVLVAWEHTGIVKLARKLMIDFGGDSKSVPKWDSEDFDSIYVLRITRDGTTPTIAFEHKHEGLDGQPTTCPVQPH